MLLITGGNLFWYIFIGITGMGFLIYGRKKPDALALIAGIVLVAYPYFISSMVWNIIAGLAIIVVYFILKRVGL